MDYVLTLLCWSSFLVCLVNSKTLTTYDDASVTSYDDGQSSNNGYVPSELSYKQTAKTDDGVTSVNKNRDGRHDPEVVDVSRDDADTTTAAAAHDIHGGVKMGVKNDGKVSTSFMAASR